MSASSFEMLKTPIGPKRQPASRRKETDPLEQFAIEQLGGRDEVARRYVQGHLSDDRRHTQLGLLLDVADDEGWGDALRERTLAELVGESAARRKKPTAKKTKTKKTKADKPRGKQPTAMREQVRQAVAHLGEGASAAEIAAAAGIAMPQVHWQLKALTRDGELERKGKRGSYTWELA